MDVPDALRELGHAYIEHTRVQRKLGTPFFIDRMPNNFTHAGLIHLILPNARIIDVRGHPLACGLSLFKEHFARAQNFSYDLEDIGRYYRDYRHSRKWTAGQAMRYKRLSNLPIFKHHSGRRLCAANG